jgi:hypothetical protein
MHPYYVTAKPSRWQAAVRAARRGTVAATVLAAHLLLALAVVVLRIARVIVTIAATLAAWAELYLAQRTGKPPLGQTAGAGIAAAFAAEFTTARAQYAHAYATPAPEGAPQ